MSLNIASLKFLTRLVSFGSGRIHILSYNMAIFAHLSFAYEKQLY